MHKDSLPCNKPKFKLPLGDGACLFSSLSYLIYGNVDMALRIRADIVNHVSANWERMVPYTENRGGTPYQSEQQYIADMSMRDTYGTMCEIRAAAEIFHQYEFQVFQGGNLIATFGQALQGVRRLKFSGHFSGGHFEALIPLDELINSDITELSSSTDVMNLQSNSTTGRPKKRTKFNFKGSSINQRQITLETATKRDEINPFFIIIPMN